MREQMAEYGRLKLGGYTQALRGKMSSDGSLFGPVRSIANLFLAIKRRPGRSIAFGDLDSCEPVSRDFGFDRGRPIDRYYIENFLAKNAVDIQGRTLEIGDDSYTRQFGAERTTRREVLHVDATNPAATLVGDLSMRGVLPQAAFDCLVLTQTLHLIYDMKAAIEEMHRSLKVGGVLLLTVPGVSQVARDQWGATWFWSLTAVSARRLFEEVFGVGAVEVEAFGNVYAATAFLQGLAVEDVERRKLDVVDRAYPMIVTVRARRL